MLGSLRFRLPALFLLGIVLAGLVAALISIRFFQSYTHDARGRRAPLGVASASCSSTRARRASRRCRVASSRRRSAATASSACRRSRARALRRRAAALAERRRHRRSTTRAPADDRPDLDVRASSYLAVARPIKLGAAALRRARRREAEVAAAQPPRDARRSGSRSRSAAASSSRPARRLSHAADHAAAAARSRVAADEVAAGDYGVELPPARGSDEISTCRARFADMAAKLAESEQLSRNFLMSVSHELRTPLTAIRGHVVGAARRRDRRSRDAARRRSR